MEAQDNYHDCSPPSSAEVTMLEPVFAFVCVENEAR